MMTEDNIREHFSLRNLALCWVLLALVAWSLTAYPMTPLHALELALVVIAWIACTVITLTTWKFHIVPRASKPTDGYTFPDGFDYAASLIRHEYMRRLYNPNGKYVYVLRDIDLTGYCKIGRSAALTGRLLDFGVKLPFRVHIVTLIPCDDEVALETLLHGTFRHRRVRGEWFALQDVDIAWLTHENGLKQMLYTNGHSA